MNVTVINIKDLLKLAVKIILLILMLYIVIQMFKYIKITDRLIAFCIKKSIVLVEYIDNTKDNKNTKTSTDILNIGFGTFNINTNKDEENTVATNKIEESNEQINEIQENIITEVVEQNNIKAKYTNLYNGVEIDNQSDYEFTEEMLNPDIELNNKKDIYIYHTHTCESYTPSENFEYEASGNYRTIDLNYSVARVGTELTNFLEAKGFNVTHNMTYHDYPSYSGSYTRSLETAQTELGDLNTEMVIDLHRDAVGDGDSYGPTVKINDKYAAQLMFVMGTDGGGLEHSNWLQNLKFAIKVQEKSNEMYPGLFRPIIVRNSRYNQHIRNCACIIEVGATGNTMEQCIYSMQCLANIMYEVCK